MSRRKPLTCQSRKVCIVIRKNKEISVAKLKEFCLTYFERYAFIEHKGDLDAETGEVIPVHYHIVGDYISAKTPFSTRLNDICTFFRFDNANGIEIDQYNSFEASLQYLTHKNQSEKTPHNKDEIIHNLSDADFNILYNADVGQVITFDLLFTIVINANNIIDVIREIGLGNYRTWRSVIWDMWRTLQGDQQYISNDKWI